ncbi:exo-beta-N-acetylmuramidase NamZ family protein [Flammeovirga pacifica]|uniref:DUF1343 domain-containing protein n=1 Tax=Flammeovirga pacifica TaxID=915059 RepID=A0A1S1YWB1_FLAPC|nr:DUF1343 domain-containing protein [Flammeovirga pacifica]OHX65314.1 hypothetical protein NH26_02595 [Flammeovirga pacifica]
MKNFITVVLTLIIFSCSASKQDNTAEAQKESTPPIIVGAEQTEKYVPYIKGKKIGLLVNQTSTIKGIHIVDSLHNRGLDIQMIFAPEHGFRGNEDAGAHVKDGIDPSTGVKIYSIYGKNKRPSPDLLKEVDIIIFDIQDVGCRFYTYISSMHYMMEACQEAGVPLLILDRPNPNGMYIDGPVLKKEFTSFVGMHPIPILHGLTVGELARMINGEKWLRTKKECELTIIPVLNYNHAMEYSLPIKPSPNLPNDQSIKLYPSLCFFEATPVSIGRGTDFPFQVIGYNNKTMGEFNFSPRSIKGAASNPVLKDQKCYGEDLRNVQQGGLDLSYIIGWNEKFSENEKKSVISKNKWMDLLSGTDSLRIMIDQKKSQKEIKDSWQKDLKTYKQIRKNYLIYTDSKY